MKSLRLLNAQWRPLALVAIGVITAVAALAASSALADNLLLN